MILHLFNDEKVVNRTIESFEIALPKHNYYLCFVEEDSPQKVIPNTDVYFVKKDGIIPIDISSINITTVIVHFLNYRKILFIEKYVRKDVPIYWIMWGGDFYNRILSSHGYPIYYRTQYLGIRYFVKRILNACGYQTKIDRQTLNFIRNRVKYCLTSKPEFFLCLKYCNYVFNNKVLINDFFYYPIDKILGEHLLDSSVKGNIILLGNAASFTNNHDYAYKYLKHVNLNGKTIVAPLSYGGDKSYINHVVEQGKRLFGDNFKGLLKFLPLDEYNRLMLNAEICVFSSWRQEANGNVIIALYLGSKVFMSHRSPLYTYYKNMGIKLFELESVTNEEIRIPLSVEDKAKNREILINNFSLKRQIESIQKIWNLN